MIKERLNPYAKLVAKIVSCGEEKIKIEGEDKETLCYVMYGRVIYENRDIVIPCIVKETSSLFKQFKTFCENNKRLDKYIRLLGTVFVERVRKTDLLNIKIGSISKYDIEPVEDYITCLGFEVLEFKALSKYVLKDTDMNESLNAIDYCLCNGTIVSTKEVKITESATPKDKYIIIKVNPTPMENTTDKREKPGIDFYLRIDKGFLDKYNNDNIAIGRSVKIKAFFVVKHIYYSAKCKSTGEMVKILIDRTKINIRKLY